MAETIPPEPDEALVARARRGEQDAFAELVTRWQRPLFAKALRNSRNLEDADDLVQETFLRAWRELGRFRDDGAFGGWLLRIMANLLADRGRRRGRETPGAEALAEALPDPGPRPDDELARGELEDALRRALDAIPPGRRREVFRMRFVEGMAVNEIAEALGVHSGTVKVHVFRLVRDLKRRLAGKEDA